MTPARRPGSAADAIVGVVPAEVVEPTTLDEAAAIIAAAERARQRLAFVGGGTALGLGAAPEGLDLVVRTGALQRVVEYAPLDQIVTVECGVRLGELQRVLFAHRQMLALDPPRADLVTVGGAVATAAFGPRRTRYGGVRDLIIGASFIRADGVRARGGGKVVKNVAGFDVPKLLVGSLGTLGMIATVTFRLHPLPDTTATILFTGATAADAERVLAVARRLQLEPDAAALVDAGDFAQLGVRFAGFAPAVDDQVRRLLEAVAGLGLTIEGPDAVLEDRFWTRHDFARTARAGLRAKVAMLPSLLPGAVNEGGPLARLRASLANPSLVLYPTLGLGFVAGDVEGGDAHAAAVVAAISDARIELSPRGGSVVLHEAPPSVRARLDVWGAPPAVHSPVPLMRAVKQRLDPERRLAPGRFFAGL